MTPWCTQRGGIAGCERGASGGRAGGERGACGCERPALPWWPRWQVRRYELRINQTLPGVDVLVDTDVQLEHIHPQNPERWEDWPGWGSPGAHAAALQLPLPHQHMATAGDSLFRPVHVPSPCTAGDTSTHRALLWHIGNLTLLHNKVNREVWNYSFKKKARRVELMDEYMGALRGPWKVYRKGDASFPPQKCYQRALEVLG